MRCAVLALNGTEDHVHLVLAIPAAVAISDIVKQIKGASSFFVNQALKPREQFKWQGSYGAFTISRWEVERAIQYVRRQKEHHAAPEPRLQEEWEETFEEAAD
jgi:REP element-mobilizing transposase RayT